MSDLSDLLRQAEPPTAGFTPDDVLVRATAQRRRTRVTGATVIALLLITMVGVVVVARPDPTVQVITPPPPTSMPIPSIAPEPTGNPLRAGEFLGAVRDLPEEEEMGGVTAWRVRDGDPTWWLKRGAGRDGTWCLVRGTAEGIPGVGVRAGCGVIPFATTISAPEELVAVVVPDGYDTATHGGATADVEHNVAILPSDGSVQPRVTLTGPAGTLDVHANLLQTAELRPPQLSLAGGRTADPEEIAAVAEATDPSSTDPTAARAADTDATTTVVLRQGEPFQGTACIGLLPSGRGGASCIPMDEDARVIADGPLLTAVDAEGARAYLVENGWTALRLPDGREVPSTINTITIPADAQDAVSALLRHTDGREIVISLHRPLHTPPAPVTAQSDPQPSPSETTDPPELAAIEGAVLQIEASLAAAGYEVERTEPTPLPDGTIATTVEVRDPDEPDRPLSILLRRDADVPSWTLDGFVMPLGDGHAVRTGDNPGWTMTCGDLQLEIGTSWLTQRDPRSAALLEGITAFADDVASALPCDPAPVASRLGDSPAGQLLAQLDAVDGVAVGHPTLSHDPAGDVTGYFDLLSTDADSETVVMVGYDEAVRSQLGQPASLTPLGDGEAARVGFGALAFECGEVPLVVGHLSDGTHDLAAERIVSELDCTPSAPVLD